MAAKLQAINPYFLVDDVYATAEYYRDTLGFRFDQFWGEPPKFVMVRRDGLQIMLRERDDDKDSVIRPNRDRVEYALDAYLYCDDDEPVGFILRDVVFQIGQTVRPLIRKKRKLRRRYGHRRRTPRWPCFGGYIPGNLWGRKC
ncbi:MAG: hypothetical protein AAF525_12640, partial [Pseudomonadota bacterium]